MTTTDQLPDLSLLDGERPDPEPRNPAEAIRLEVTADDEVERLGVPGTHPEIRAAAGRAAAGRAADAHRGYDLAGVRAACDEMTSTARRLAGVGRP
jgi:hypothetical protein